MAYVRIFGRCLFIGGATALTAYIIYEGMKEEKTEVKEVRDDILLMYLFH